jgi:putative ABC transport system permease protein
MYTTVVERTRQIGVLKSLGASRAFIGLTIEREALVISMLGVFVGYVVALTAAAIIRASTTLTIEFEPQWFIATGLLGLGSGLVGALYPALRAARMDPVEALAHE